MGRLAQVPESWEPPHHTQNVDAVRGRRQPLLLLGRGRRAFGGTRFRWWVVVLRTCGVCGGRFDQSLDKEGGGGHTARTMQARQREDSFTRGNRHITCGGTYILDLRRASRPLPAVTATASSCCGCWSCDRCCTGVWVGVWALYDVPTDIDRRARVLGCWGGVHEDCCVAA